MSEWHESFETVLRPHLRYLAEDAPVNPHESLLALGVDSMGTVQILVDIEDAFGILFPDEMLTQETFRTPASLWQVLSALIAERRV